MKSLNSAYNPAIDHLRAFAALLVVFFHGTLFFYNAVLQTPTGVQWLPIENPIVSVIAQGHMGVGLFMTLSGFLFTTICYRRQFSYATFLSNRVLRIFPLYIAILLFGLYALPLETTFDGLMASLLGFGNTAFKLTASPVTDVLWTISVEFQFYLLFPFLLRFFESQGRGYMVKLVAVFLILRMFALALGGPVDLNQYTLLGRMDQFVAGMLIGAAYMEHRETLLRHSGLLLAAGVIGLVLMTHVLNSVYSFKAKILFLAFLPTMEAAVWAAIVTGYVGVARHIPAWISRALCFVGDISFSVYLTHYFIIHAFIKKKLYFQFENLTPLDNAFLSCFVVLIVVLGFSYLTYHTIELPFLNLRRRYVKGAGMEPAAAIGKT